MRIKQFVLPAAALSAAAILLWPTQSRGFTTIGGSLSLLQRDARIFNNFTDAQANNNTIPDTNWPGYTGAPLAIWKSVAEWASELHGGTGAGDPTQTVGSGGANFDAAWGGLATGIGNINDNVVSELAGSSGGVLAYCETPIADGWRIRFYSGWTWHDGPGTVTGGIDIQGVATHEYGHALGLGHTTVGGSTMYASVSGSGTAQRSIEADDIAGVQFVYGVKSALKPHIGAITGTSVLTISGTNFAAANNEVWFASATPTGGTTPLVKATGIASQSGGTQIVVAVPAGAGAGDVFVKSGAGNTHADLSNGWPYDPSAGSPCNPPVSYCTAKTLSTGGIASAGWSGTNSLSVDDFHVLCFNGVPNKTGVPYYSSTQAAIPFQGGFLCAQPPVLRGAPFNFDITGYIDIAWPITAQMVGTTENIGFWFRDPQNPDGTNVGLSDAISVTYCP